MTVAIPPTTSATPPSRAAVSARVSRRAASGWGTPISSAWSPSRRISPTGTERDGTRPR